MPTHSPHPDTHTLGCAGLGEELYRGKMTPDLLLALNLVTTISNYNLKENLASIIRMLTSALHDHYRLARLSMR